MSTILLKMKIINNLNGIVIGIQLHVKYHIYFIYHYYSAAVYVDVALLHVFFSVYVQDAVYKLIE